MRKLSFFLAFALVLTFACGAFSQTVVVSVDNVTNEYTPTQLNSGKAHEISIRFNLLGAPNPGFWVGGNGFEIYSPDGADWVGLQGYPGPLVDVAAARGTLSTFAKHYNSPDRTIAGNWIETASGGSTPAGGYTGVNSGAAFYIATLSIFGDAGFIGGTDNGIGMTMNFNSLTADAGLSICLDTVTQGIVAWEWAAPGTPDFPVYDNGHGGDGPYCWEIYEVPNLPPEWCTAEEAVSFNHCGQGSFTLCATDPDPEISGGVVTYALATGFDDGTFGEVNGGVWTWSGATVPQSGSVDIEFVANDGIANSDANFVLHVTLTNNAPVITACPGGLATVSAGGSRALNVLFNDPDVCDAPYISGVDYADIAGDNVVIAGNSVEFFPAAGTARPSVPMTVFVTDGDEVVECLLEWNVIIGSKYQVELEKVHDAYQGGYVDLDIILHAADAEDGLGGFDFLVAYDASALAFQVALEADLYADPYNWEYFTYRYGPNGNCGNACPSGMLRVVGLAETNNGVASATCVTDAELKPVLATLRFLVSNDRNLECQYVPVRFFWFDCTDNILSSCDGGTAYLSASVYDYVNDFNFQDGEMSDPFVGFPTFQGAQDGCLFEQGEKVAADDVDFQNGGIDIICADSIDARGDINLNGLAYEIADAVMFTNYFINGLGAFGSHVEGSIAASDVNADGIALSVADLVYLVRVVVGDAAPYAKVAPVAANVTYGNERFNVDVDMGAAHIVMEGNVTPTLLAGNMEMLYASNGQTTSILVYSTEIGHSFRGDFLQVNGNVVSTEFATYDGYPVAAKVMPTDFVVEQNYPNPFNPSTKFDFTVPNGGEWNLGVYNITGQLVQSFSGVSETGYESVTWDASDLSSGIYFYRVSAAGQSVTKKAVLLK